MREKKPVPAILEHLPYRKNDGTVKRDTWTHPYLAGHGYACIRVDMRGNGDSNGLMDDEYTAQELQDACDVIAWAAAQPWCNGKVGMMGISWGGFNALQVAALRPPALKAIITLCSTDDRYADDIHYKGGLLLHENIGWGATMLSFSSRPPDPALVGKKWRRMWKERLDANPLLHARWMRHPTRDEYWKHGSVCENYSAIEAKVLAVGGWGDAYKNAVSRIVTNVDRRKGHCRPVDPQIPAFRAAKPDRLPAGSAALVGPLVEGHRHRRRKRSGDAHIRAGKRAPESPGTIHAPATGSPKRIGLRPASSRSALR